MNTLKNSNLILSASICFALSGCSWFSSGYKYDLTIPSPKVYNKDAQIQQSLNNLAEVAKDATNQLSQLQRINTAVKMSKLNQNDLMYSDLSQQATPIGWDQTASIDYTGNFYNLANELAKQANYKINVSSLYPIGQNTVSISMKNKTLQDILNNALLQTNKNTVVKQYPATKEILLSYETK